MRFRANIHNPKALGLLCQTIQKVNKQCTLKLDKTRTRFICQTDLVDGSQVWASVKTGTMFSQFRIESQTEDQIYLSVDLPNFARAVRSGEQATDMIIRLSKKGSQPMLSITMSVQSGGGTGGDRPRHEITQEVPVRVLTANEIANLNLPACDQPKVEIYLPQLKEMRNVVEGMRVFSPHVSLVADMAGSLTLTGITNTLTTSTYFKNLEHPIKDGGGMHQPDPTIKTECKVDVKKLCHFLQVQLLQPRSVLCCLVENCAVILRVSTVDEITLVYFLPCVG
eukprot:TRINITY_DN69484_c0_g1_i1.p1 TRINITY_DN69484_c0_g1~~TRINITY_DN69484_c0_g1_i1.p1  ORF type:complete len:281 (+),score=15.44 TRINITY_DN69484_c0_g1_i1:43-885(+)